MLCRVGKSDLRVVLQSQVALYAARLSLQRVWSEQLIQRVNLHRAFGGSFEMPPAQRPGPPEPQGWP